MKQVGRRISVFTVALATAVSLGASVANAQTDAAGKSSESAAHTRAKSGEIDTLSYLLDTRHKTLTGTHALSQTVRGNVVYNVLWDANSYEVFTYDDNYIYLPEDHSAGQKAGGSYTWSDGRWMARQMNVGSKITIADNTITYYDVHADSCTEASHNAYPYIMTLLSHIPDYDLGGTVGKQDVVVLQYDYRSTPDGTDYEKVYYAKGLGMVKWELYRNDKVIQTSIFNQYSDKAPTPPNLREACKKMPEPTESPTDSPEPTRTTTGTPRPSTPAPSAGAPTPVQTNLGVTG